MAELIRGLDPARIRANLTRIRAEIAAAAAECGRDPGGIELLAATKYVATEDMPLLAQAGVTLAGENRAQDLEAKAAATGETFTWDFIGHLQSRKVRQVLPLVRYVHSVSSDSVLEQLGRHGNDRTRVLIEVNIAGDPGKSGISAAQLPGFIERCPVVVVGLMTMPPLTASAEDSRRHFEALRELAQRHGLAELSMGTSQDYVVAVHEGATIVRLGSSLYR